MAEKGRDLSAWIVACSTRVAEQLAQGLAGETSNVRRFVADEPAQDVEQALKGKGQPDLVLVSMVPESQLHVLPIEKLSPGDWQFGVHQPIMAYFHILQALGRGLRGSGASIVVLGTTLGHVGAKGLSPLCTLLECQRSMVRSAARQWGEHGLTVNWIAVAPTAFSPELDKAEMPQGPEFGPPHRALGRAPTLAEAASAACLLDKPAGRLLTGGTINVDGGEWLVP